MPETAQLYNWYEMERDTTDLKRLGGSGEGATSGGGSFGRDLRFISTVQALRLGEHQQQYVNVRAMITRIKPENSLYKSCPNDNCKKKLVELDGGEYRCEKCSQTTTDFRWSYMLQFELTDATGQVYATAFSDVGQKLLGYEAQRLGEIKESDEEQFKAVFARAHFNYHNFRIRCKYETYNEEVRLRVTVVGVDEVPYDNYIEQLKKTIEKLEAITV